MTTCHDHGGKSKRYSSVRFGGEVIGKHVKALILKEGDKRPLYALHTCCNPRCINPDHLYWGNQSQNIKDAVKDGTHVVHRVFTDDEVKAILAEHIPYSRQHGGAAIAKRYNACPQSVNHIIRNKGY
jgi:hypothetical protein